MILNAERLVKLCAREIQGRGRVRQCPDADAVHARLGDPPHRAQVDPAGGLQLDVCPTGVAAADRLGQVLRTHVVQQDEVGPGRQDRFEFAERVQLDFDNRPAAGLSEALGEEPPGQPDGLRRREERDRADFLQRPADSE